MSNILLNLLRSTLVLPLVKQRTKLIEKSATNPYDYQKNILNKIVHRCRNTELGKRYGLDQVKSLEDARLLPVMNYELLRPYIERIYQAGAGGRGILSWSAIEAFAITSGTSGGLKYFPITKDSLAMFKNGGLNLYVSALNALKNPADLLKGKVLYLSAMPHKFYSPTGLNVGYMSGYMHLKRHFLYRDLIYPTVSTSLIHDANKKMLRTFEEIRNQDIHVVFGFPAIIQLFTEQALSYFRVSYLRQLWPNLKFCVYGGNYLSESNIQYLKQTWIGSDQKVNELIFLENYSAVEGFFGHTFHCEWPGLVFNATDIFFQFKINPADKSFVQLHELKNGVRYYVYISSLDGLINYAMDDIIQITSIKPLTFKFIARANEQISVIAEKIILAEIQYTINKLAQNTLSILNDFVVYLEREGGFHLVFVLSIDLSQMKNKYESLHLLDNALREMNPLYDDYRASNIYQMPEIKYRSPEFFNNYRIKNINIGNFKEKRLFMSEKDFNSEYTFRE